MNVETPQLDTVIIEVFSWRAKPETYYTETAKGQTFAINELDLWWHSGSTSCLNMKLLKFAKDENMFKLLLSWVMTKSVLPSVTTQMLPMTWSSWALYKDQGVHHSQATPISYTFLVADNWSSTATLSYKPLCQFVSLMKFVLSCTSHAFHSTLYGNSASLEDQPTSSKGLCSVLSS